MQVTERSCESVKNKCTSEGLMHVVAWYHGTPGPKFTKFEE